MDPGQMKKLAISISVGLNVALTAVLVLCMAPSRQSLMTVDSPAPFTPAPLLREDVVSASNPGSAVTENEPFRWSQIESGDQKKYVSNLRSIGCPERTLRAIVASDLDAIYEKRARELEQKLADVKNASLSVRLSSLGDEASLREQLQRLSAEENSQIDDLLGSNPASPRATPDLAAAVPARTQMQSVRAPVAPQMPLVLQNVDVSALGVNSEQMQVIEDLRQSFSEAVGGPDQNPSDPAYLARWQRAQPEIDNQLRGLLGVRVFENFEMAVQPPEEPLPQKQ